MGGALRFEAEKVKMMEGTKGCGRSRVTGSRRIEPSTQELLYHSAMDPTSTEVQTDIMDSVAINDDKNISGCW